MEALEWAQQLLSNPELTMQEVNDGFPLLQIMSLMNSSIVDLEWYSSDEAFECQEMNIRIWQDIQQGFEALGIADSFVAGVGDECLVALFQNSLPTTLQHSSSRKSMYETQEIDNLPLEYIVNDPAFKCNLRWMISLMKLKAKGLLSKHILSELKSLQLSLRTSTKSIQSELIMPVLCSGQIYEMMYYLLTNQQQKLSQIKDLKQKSFEFLEFLDFSDTMKASVKTFMQEYHPFYESIHVNIMNAIMTSYIQNFDFSRISLLISSKSNEPSSLLLDWINSTTKNQIDSLVYDLADYKILFQLIENYKPSTEQIDQKQWLRLVLGQCQKNELLAPTWLSQEVFESKEKKRRSIEFRDQEQFRVIESSFENAFICFLLELFDRLVPSNVQKKVKIQRKLLKEVSKESVESGLREAQLQRQQSLLELSVAAEAPTALSSATPSAKAESVQTFESTSSIQKGNETDESELTDDEVVYYKQDSKSEENTKIEEFTDVERAFVSSVTATAINAFEISEIKREAEIDELPEINLDISDLLPIPAINEMVVVAETEMTLPEVELELSSTNAVERIVDTEIVQSELVELEVAQSEVAATTLEEPEVAATTLEEPEVEAVVLDEHKAHLPIVDIQKETEALLNVQDTVEAGATTLPETNTEAVFISKDEPFVDQVVQIDTLPLQSESILLTVEEPSLDVESETSLVDVESKEPEPIADSLQVPMANIEVLPVANAPIAVETETEEFETVNLSSVTKNHIVSQFIESNAQGAIPDPAEQVEIKSQSSQFIEIESEPVVTSQSVNEPNAELATEATTKVALENSQGPVAMFIEAPELASRSNSAKSLPKLRVKSAKRPSISSGSSTSSLKATSSTHSINQLWTEEDEKQFVESTQMWQSLLIEPLGTIPTASDNQLAPAAEPDLINRRSGNVQERMQRQLELKKLREQEKELLRREQEAALKQKLQEKKKVLKAASPVKQPAIKLQSNRQLIRNALQHVCLAGAVNDTLKEQVLEEIDSSSKQNFIILFRGQKSHLFRGLYEFDPELDQVLKLFGSSGPDVLSVDQVTEFYKYDSGSKSFKALPTRSFNRNVHAVAIELKRIPKPL